MRLLHCAALLVALAGCASAPEVVRPLNQPAANVVDDAFRTSGRLAVNYQGRGHVAAFDWQHASTRDQLDVKTPLGNTVASLTRDAGGVQLRADGRDYYASDVETLTEDILGWPLPLSNLAWWARGQSAPGVAASQADDGRLQQQGWLIRNLGEAGSGKPRRLELERDGVSIRLLFSDWHWLSPQTPN